MIDQSLVNFPASPFQIGDTVFLTGIPGTGRIIGVTQETLGILVRYPNGREILVRGPEIRAAFRSTNGNWHGVDF